MIGKDLVAKECITRYVDYALRRIPIEIYKPSNSSGPFEIYYDKNPYTTVSTYADALDNLAKLREKGTSRK